MIKNKCSYEGCQRTAQWELVVMLEHKNERDSGGGPVLVIGPQSMDEEHLFACANDLADLIQETQVHSKGCCVKQALVWM